MVERLDQKLLSLYTRFAYWFQIRFGKSSYFLAKICAFVCVIIDGFVMIDYWFVDIFPSQRNIFWLVVESGFCVGYWVVIFSLNRADERFKEGIVRPHALFDIETARQAICGGFVKIRVWLFLILSVLTALQVCVYIFFRKTPYTYEHVIGEIFLFFGWSTMYFIFIDPLPPDQIKAKAPVGAKYAPNR